MSIPFTVCTSWYHSFRPNSSSSRSTWLILALPDSCPTRVVTTLVMVCIESGCSSVVRSWFGTLMKAYLSLHPWLCKKRPFCVRFRLIVDWMFLYQFLVGWGHGFERWTGFISPHSAQKLSDIIAKSMVVGEKGSVLHIHLLVKVLTINTYKERRETVIKYT